jgi:HAD superfamily hydrolase (TIGR01509 family)
MKLSLAIFDLDGTVIDSKEAWGKAYAKVLTSLGKIPNIKHPETAGVAIKKNWENILQRYNIKTDKTLDELVAFTYSEYEKFIPEIKLNDGVVEFIENLKSDDISVALATSASWSVVDKALKNLAIERLFDCITTGEEVWNQKPNPDIFIKTAEKFSVEPDDCLVFEDSLSGVEAAKAAGMKVIAIDPTGVDAELNVADLVVGSFLQVSPAKISSL